MDKLVQYFLQSARPDGGDRCSAGGAPLEPEATERGVAAVEAMLMSQDAAAMVGSPAATLVCLAMALEEKPNLQEASVRCYERALAHLPAGRGAGAGSGHRQQGSGWERCVVLQQLGAVCVRHGRLADAEPHLKACAEECAFAKGHPRDAVLFSGGFTTQQTRHDFAAMVAKLRAKLYLDMGDQDRSKECYQEVQRLAAAVSGDAVERSAGVAVGVGKASVVKAADAEATAAATLWAASVDEERRLVEYRYADEGPTVLLILELNEHLGLGEGASALVVSLRQFRVEPHNDALDVKLRLRCGGDRGLVWEFHLLLHPLAHEIVPEDTVPRLRGREDKRRLEVRLFKREKQQVWHGDLVRSGATVKMAAVPSTSSKASGAITATASAKGGREAPDMVPTGATKGTLLNPLSQEELAALPTPSGTAGLNRPSAWQQAMTTMATTAVALPRASPAAPVAPAVSLQTAEPVDGPVVVARGHTLGNDSLIDRQNAEQLPSWVENVNRRLVDGSVFELRICLGASAGEDVGMDNLDLGTGDPVGDGASLRLQLLTCNGNDATVATLPQHKPLKLQLPPGADATGLSARWRRKTRVLELRVPCCR